jgi:hypothetical protein
MTDERRERLARLESQGKLDKDGDDAGFLRTVRLTGTQQEADRAQRVLDRDAQRQAARKQAKKTAKQGDDDVKSVANLW